MKITKVRKRKGAEVVKWADLLVELALQCRDHGNRIDRLKDAVSPMVQSGYSVRSWLMWDLASVLERVAANEKGQR